MHQKASSSPAWNVPLQASIIPRPFIQPKPETVHQQEAQALPNLLEILIRSAVAPPLPPIQPQSMMGQATIPSGQETDHGASPVVVQSNAPAFAHSATAQSLERHAAGTTRLQPQLHSLRIQGSPTLRWQQQVPPGDSIQLQTSLPQQKAVVVAETLTDLEPAIAGSKERAQSLEPGLKYTPAVPLSQSMSLPALPPEQSAIGQPRLDDSQQPVGQRSVPHLSTSTRQSNLALENHSFIQRTVLYGTDSEFGETARKGYQRFFSPAEIQNSNTFLRKQDREGKGSYHINDLANQQIEYDSVNYLNGHYEVGKGYLGKTAEQLAAFLASSGLKSGQNIVLLGCESAGFAQELAMCLNRQGIAVTVTGAEGIAFDYEEDGAVKEAMYRKEAVPKAVQEKYRIEKQYEIAHKYEEIFINEITQKIVRTNNETMISEFLSYFQQIGGALIKYSEATNDSDAAKYQEYETTARLYSGMIKSAPPEDIAGIPESPDAETLVQWVQEKPIKRYSKNQLIRFRKILEAKVPKEIKAATKVEELKKQVEAGGTYILKKYTSKDQLWLMHFMDKVIHAEDSLVKAEVIDLYQTIGRQAANEYVKQMCQGYNAEAQGSILEKGWKTFTDQDEEIMRNSTYREAADTLSRT